MSNSSTSELDYNSSINRESHSDINSSDSEGNINIDLIGDIIGDYNVIAMLGKGGYSKVWLAYNINDMKYYALKVINANDYDDGKEELKTMSIIPKDEKYINGLKEHFVETRFIDDNATKFLCIVYYLCAGNLDGLGRKGQYDKGYPPNMVKTFILQTLEALNCVHYKLKGFHGDIKPDNILLCGYNNRDKQYIDMYDKFKFNDIYSRTKKEYCNEKNIKKLDMEKRQRIRLKVHRAIIDNMEANKEDQYRCHPNNFNNIIVKLTDFGFFCKHTEQFNKPFGTRYYMAPEIILMGDCSEKVDIWALGCMIYELLTGKILFDPHSSPRGSTDFHHLEMMICMCEEFDKSTLHKTKHYKKFFKNDKLRDIKYSDDYKIPLVEKLNIKLKEHNINNINIAKLIASTLQLNPKGRPSVRELVGVVNGIQW
jgi:serine/threonine-protein kinase SRPK3